MANKKLLFMFLFGFTTGIFAAISIKYPVNGEELKTNLKTNECDLKRLQSFRVDISGHINEIKCQDLQKS